MAHRTWQDRLSALEEALGWLEANAPRRTYEISDTRERLEATKTKMRELGKRPSSPLTQADKWVLA